MKKIVTSIMSLVILLTGFTSVQAEETKGKALGHYKDKAQGKALGHYKDKAQGKAVGHQKEAASVVKEPVVPVVEEPSPLPVGDNTGTVLVDGIGGNYRTEVTASANRINASNLDYDIVKIYVGGSVAGYTDIVISGTFTIPTGDIDSEYSWMQRFFTNYEKLRVMDDTGKLLATYDEKGWSMTN